MCVCVAGDFALWLCTRDEDLVLQPRASSLFTSCNTGSCEAASARFPPHTLSSSSLPRQMIADPSGSADPSKMREVPIEWLTQVLDLLPLRQVFVCQRVSRRWCFAARSVARQRAVFDAAWDDMWMPRLRECACDSRSDCRHRSATRSSMKAAAAQLQRLCQPSAGRHWTLLPASLEQRWG